MFFHLLQIQENKSNRKSHWCSNRLHQHHKDLLRTHQYLNKNRAITFILKAESNWFSLSSLSNTLIILKNNLPLSSLSPPLIYLLSLHQISQVIDAFDTQVILYLRGTSFTRKMKHCEVISPRSIHKVIDDSNQSPHQLRLTQPETVLALCEQQAEIQQGNLPLQTIPLPVNPFLQVQVYDPSSLEQTAFSSQGLPFFEHSSMSTFQQKK